MIFNHIWNYHSFIHPPNLVFNFLWNGFTGEKFLNQSLDNINFNRESLTLYILAALYMNTLFLTSTLVLGITVRYNFFFSDHWWILNISTDAGWLFVFALQILSIALFCVFFLVLRKHIIVLSKLTLCIEKKLIILPTSYLTLLSCKI